MNIQLNGKSHQIQEGTSIAALLQQLEIRTDRVAVEVNLEILDKSGFNHHILQDGDRVEVMSFIGGGSVGSPSSLRMTDMFFYNIVREAQFGL